MDLNKNNKKRKLLITTQVVDSFDPMRGFFLDWIEKISLHYESVLVICLKKGVYNLPDNVKVVSLGKEDKGNVFLKKIKYILNFYKYILIHRREYDDVFVHMNQIYVILGGVLWRFWNKKIGLWYAHGAVSRSLELSEYLVDVIYTASQESCRLKKREKIEVVGHGINMQKFKNNLKNQEEIKDKVDLKIISVGRISPIKDYETIIQAIKIVSNTYNVRVSIVGDVGNNEQKQYLEKLKSLIKENNLENNFCFLGPKKHDEIVNYLKNSDMFVSCSRTGSLDKVLLEAMLCEIPVISSNEYFFRKYNKQFPFLCFKKNDHNKLADNIVYLVKNKQNKIWKELLLKMKKSVQDEHDLSGLVKKIVVNYNDMNNYKK